MFLPSPFSAIMGHPAAVYVFLPSVKPVFVGQLLFSSRNRAPCTVILRIFSICSARAVFFVNALLYIVRCLMVYVRWCIGMECLRNSEMERGGNFVYINDVESFVSIEEENVVGLLHI